MSSAQRARPMTAPSGNAPRLAGARAGSDRAFTLIELIVSLAIVSILIGATGSIMVLASRAVPDGTSVAERSVSASSAADQIATELSGAVYVPLRSSRAITFLVPDRDGDGSPERISYSWSGTSGDPLTRTYNGAASGVVLSSVDDLTFTYEIRSVSEQYADVPIVGSEQTFGTRTTASDGNLFSVDANNWIGQYVQPTLPGDALAWRVTRVDFKAKQKDAADGSSAIEVRAADANLEPTLEVFQQQPLLESALPVNPSAWVQVVFDTVEDLLPEDDICVVVRNTGPGKAGRFEYDGDGGSGRVKTSNGGYSWSYKGDESMLYTLIGRVLTPGPQVGVSRDYVTGVRVSIRSGGETAAGVSASARLLNAPPAATIWWEADFSYDPTSIEFNGDGVGDWAMSGGTPFDPLTLSNGVWNANGTLETAPNTAIAELTTVDVDFRDATTTGSGVGLRVNLDRGGAQELIAYATLVRQGDGTQVLTVGTYADLKMSRKLVVRGLGTGFVRLRLVLNPVRDSLNVTVDGQDRGTFAVPRSAATGAALVQLYPLVGDAGAQFDRAQVVVGGTP